jgi:tetratricopeptide (TPR) repeat protein/ribosomal protein L40E
MFNNKFIFVKYFLVFLFSAIFLCLPSIAPAAQREAENYNAQGLKFLEQGDIRRAFMEFKKASDYDSLYADPLYYQGIIYEKRGSLEEARQKFEAAIAVSPQDPKIILKINKFIYKDFLQFLDENELEKAEKIIDVLLNSEPRNPEYIFGQGRFFIKKENWEAAAKSLYQVIQMGNNYEIPDELKHVLAMSHAYYSLVSFQQKKYYDAYFHIRNAQKKAVKTNPEIENIMRMVAGDENPVVKLWRDADSLYNEKKYSLALKKYQEVLTYHRAIKEVQDRIEQIEKIFRAVELNNKAEQFYKVSKWEEAKAVYIQIQELGFNEEKIKQRIEELDKRIFQLKNPKIKVDLSDSAFQKNLEFMQQHELFGEIEDNFFDRYSRAQNLYDKEDYAAAMGLYQSIYMDNPDYEDVSVKMKKCQEFLENKKKSNYATIVYAILVLIGVIFLIKLFKKSLPLWHKSRLMKSLEKSREKKNWKKVISICKKLITYTKSEKEVAKINLNISQAFLYDGQYNKALEHAQLVLKCDHRSTAAHSVMAKSFLETNNVSDVAIKEYQNLIKLEPKNMKLLKILTDYYVKRESIDKDALDIYKRLLKYEPDNFKVLELTGVSYKESGRMDAEALRVYEEIIQKDPGNMEFHQTLARAYFEKELFEEAINHSRIYLNHLPENKAVNKIFQQSFIKLKKLTECILEYERIAEKFTESKFLKRTIDKLYEMRSLAGDSGGASKDSSSSANPAMSGQKSIFVCSKCACLNSPGAKICKRCQAPLG